MRIHDQNLNQNLNQKDLLNKVLLIDDCRDICDFVIARTYEAGVFLLRKCDWDLLLLDHDLGCFENGKEYTGYDILCWLEKHPKRLPKEIRVVSSNPPARQKMELVIKKLYTPKPKYDDKVTMVLPAYVWLNTIVLRRTGSEYYRDGGQWGIDVKQKDGKLYASCSGHKRIHHVELIPATKEEYIKSNGEHAIKD